MTAEPSDLENRVTELEHQMRHVQPYRVGSVASGVNALHAETMERLGEHGERLDRIDLHLDRQDERLDAIDGRLDRHDQRFDGIDRRLDKQAELLQEILRRLPE